MIVLKKNSVLSDSRSRRDRCRSIDSFALVRVGAQATPTETGVITGVAISLLAVALVVLLLVV